MGKRNINKEECYKIELLITMDNTHPNYNKALDDILFKALEDAPFHIDTVTIEKKNFNT